MLETLVEWVTNAIANGLDALVVGFMQALNFSISSIAEAFPILVTAYAVFQSVALALIVIIAGYHIWKYTTGQLSEATETPGSILFRAFAAGVLVFMGGYIVQWVVDIAKLPYDAILALDAATGIWQTEGIIESNLNVTELVLNCGALFSGVGGQVVIITQGATAVFSLIMVILIAFNVVKLLVEVCQRYLMIGVLTYSAPLAFATAATKDTSQILSKWVSMFLGQCLLMTLSVWTLKAIVSGFSYNPDSTTNYLIRFVLTLGMCKLAQRLDSYIQQLGINAATTGGNLLGEALGAVAMLSGRGLMRNQGSKTTVLGGAKGGMKSALGHGIFGAVPRAYEAARSEFARGGSKDEVTDAFKKTWANHASPAKTLWDNITSGNVFGKEATAKRKEALKERTQASQEAYDRRATTFGRTPMYDFQKTAKRTAAAAQEAAKTYPTVNGAGEFAVAADGSIDLSEDAKKLGLRLEETEAGTSYIAGEGSVVSDFMTANYADSGSNQEQQQIMKDTVQESPNIVSEAVMWDYETDLPAGKHLGNGHYENDAVGNAMLEKIVPPQVTPNRESTFRNVSAKTDDMKTDSEGNVSGGGRHVYGRYTDSNDHEMALHITDETGYMSMTEAQKGKYGRYVDSSGAKYYRNVPARDNVQSETARGQTGTEDKGHMNTPGTGRNMHGEQGTTPTYRPVNQPEPQKPPAPGTQKTKPMGAYSHETDKGAPVDPQNVSTKTYREATPTTSKNVAEKAYNEVPVVPQNITTGAHKEKPAGQPFTPENPKGNNERVDTRVDAARTGIEGHTENMGGPNKLEHSSGKQVGQTAPALPHERDDASPAYSPANKGDSAASSTMQGSAKSLHRPEVRRVGVQPSEQPLDERVELGSTTESFRTQERTTVGSKGARNKNRRIDEGPSAQADMSHNKKEIPGEMKHPASPEETHRKETVNTLGDGIERNDQM